MSDLWDALRAMHDPLQGWVFFGELRAGTGWDTLSERTMDAWAICTWRSRKGSRGAFAPYLRRAFEVKISKSDRLRDLRDPDKRWYAYTVSHEFYFVAPTGIIDVAELGPDDGLLTWDGENLKLTKSPRVRTCQWPRWSFVAMLCRRIAAEERQREAQLQLPFISEEESRFLQPSVATGVGA